MKKTVLILAVVIAVTAGVYLADKATRVHTSAAAGTAKFAAGDPAPEFKVKNLDDKDLALAAASDTVARGILLLAVYSAGLAVPFLLTALGLGQFMRFYKNFRKYLHAVELVSGVLLLFVGGLVFFNRLTWLTGKLTFLNRFNL